MAVYARGDQALAICDICNFQCYYKDLRDYVQNRKKTGQRVCPDCFDQDQPQFWIGEKRTLDPQALRNPRPATIDNAFSRGFWGWNPVATFLITVTLARPTVTTS